MRQIITGIIGILFGMYLVVMYSITVTATVDDVAAGRIPLSRFSRSLNGRRVKITGRLISDGEKAAIVDNGKSAVLIQSEHAVPPGAEKTFYGRLTDVRYRTSVSMINERPFANYALNVDAGIFNVKVVIGVLVTAWGVVLIWAGVVMKKRRVAASDTESAPETSEQ